VSLKSQLALEKKGEWLFSMAQCHCYRDRTPDFEIAALHFAPAGAIQSSDRRTNATLLSLRISGLCWSGGQAARSYYSTL